MNKVTDSTLIPIGLAVLVIGGGAAWLTTVHLKMEANAAGLESIEAKMSRYSDDIHAIRQDISEIKGELKRMRR